MGTYINCHFMVMKSDRSANGLVDCGPLLRWNDKFAGK